MSENEFYVYIYLDTRKHGKYQYGEYCFDYEPFYVGKGIKERCLDHIKEAKDYLERNIKIYNKYKIGKINKIIKETGKNPIIIKVKENLLEQESFELESLLIKMIGIKGIGSLTNLSNGGCGGGSEQKSNKNCIEVCEFIKQNNKLPKCNSKDKNESKMGLWLSRKRLAINKKNNNIFYESDMVIAKQYSCEYMFNTSEKVSNNKTVKICEFIKKNNRLPNILNKNERTLYLFRERRNSNKNKSILYDSDKEIIKRYGYNNIFYNLTSLEEKSNIRVEKLCLWIKSNNRFPSRESNEKIERGLGAFLYVKRDALKNKGSCLLYDSDNVILEKYNMKFLFNTLNCKEHKSNETCHKVCKWFILNNGIKYTLDKEDRKNLIWLKTRKRAKSGKHGIFYESDQKIAESYGLKDLFEIKS